MEGIIIKRLIIVSIVLSLLLSGCYFNVEETDTKPSVYSGRTLDIGIIGELPNQSFDRVTFHKIKPASLELEEFDAYFITRDYFSEVSQEKWAPVFSSIGVPVFFIDSDIQDFVYRKENYSYADLERFPSFEHTTGFLVKEDNILKTGYGTRTEADTFETETPAWIYDLIFKHIEEYYN
ncbi:hypothetical protein DS745_02460 [Anaerobacillus alkaliphilus]|uniref:Transcription elongation factor GreAB n=1 Tax=Anaerobacillus alkaliphilus TaxID=1548597 RepID=A0A4Q0VYK9_9BACI|nr:hypothetical protein [Anaerobacillus alkaliphilus]RXJ04266.1 hypothetical protein DS745_02460 [Anaerobacillus alkaliphilus]